MRINCVDAVIASMFMAIVIRTWTHTNTFIVILLMTIIFMMTMGQRPSDRDRACTLHTEMPLHQKLAYNFCCTNVCAVKCRKKERERKTAAELEWWKYTGIWIVYEIGQSELFANNIIFSIDDTQNSLCVCVCAFCNNAKGPISNKNFRKKRREKKVAHIWFSFIWWFWGGQHRKLASIKLLK